MKAFFILRTMPTNPYNDTSTYPRERYWESPPDWETVTRKSEYEDGGVSFNELNTVAPQTWELIYTGLDPVTAKVFDDHYNQQRLSQPFLFIDKFAAQHAVFYQTFERSHNRNQSWIQQRRVVLIEYPGITVADLAFSYYTMGGNFITCGGAFLTV